MHFRSINDLYRDIWSNLHLLPRDIDLVVGIPRSGMVPATIIALARNIPLADIDGLLAGRVLSTGHTRRETRSETADMRHILVIDDSVRTGSSMQEAREKLANLPGAPKITFAAVYGTPKPAPSVDLVFAVVPEPRVFEWNVLHHPIVSRACFDIDGVLCLDPADHQNDDGEAYLDFLLTAAPLHLPRREIAMLVTSRLEKYRPATEQWLAKNGIRYRELHMLDLPDAETRRRLRCHAEFKAKVYARSNCALFIESELHQAREIAQKSGKPVLSLQGPQMVQPGAFSPKAVLQKLRPSRLSRLVERTRSLVGA